MIAAKVRNAALREGRASKPGRGNSEISRFDCDAGAWENRRGDGGSEWKLREAKP